MRIAVLSDIHGNLLALDAVMTDLESQGVDQVWCGGDLGWGGPWASECIARVREAGWKTVKGNTDVWITGDPQTIDDPDQRKQFQDIASAHNIPKEDAEWLTDLPLGHNGPGSLLLVHGTPQSPFTAPMPDAPAAEFVPYEGKASVVIYGHVHYGFVRRLTDGTIVANPGSVGLPMDGKDASYMIVGHDGPELLFMHRRVPYDRRAVISQARQVGGPLGELTLKFLGET